MVVIYFENVGERREMEDHLRQALLEICSTYESHKDDPEKLRQAYEPAVQKLFEQFPSSGAFGVNSVDLRFAEQEGGDFIFHRPNSETHQPYTLGTIDRYRRFTAPVLSNPPELFTQFDASHHPYPPLPPSLETPSPTPLLPTP